MRAVFLMAAGAALAGGFWDDAWHTERGRDSFFIVPHIAIYTGIATAGAALGAIALLRAREHGWRRALSDRTLQLAVVALAGTMISAPIDNAWHLAFGRDAVLWSPPHMLGIAGAMGLAFAMLLQSRDGTRAGALMSACAAALVLAAAMFSVAEYETDVPQFAALWYPVAFAFAASTSLALIGAAWPHRWAASIAAAGHAVFLLLTTLLITSLGFQAPALPVLLLAGPVIDLAARRGLSRPATALLMTLATMALVVPIRQGLSHLDLSLQDALLAAPLSFLAALTGLILAAGRLPTLPRAGRVAGATAAIFALLSTGASAHDPGQGTPAGKVAWAARTHGSRVIVRAAAPLLCQGAPASFVARRGGRRISAPAVPGAASCARRGTLTLPDAGRWFVYLQAHDRSGPVESWIDVSAGSRQRTVLTREAYRPKHRSASVLKWGVGALLYAAIAALLITFARLARTPGEAAVARTRPGPVSDMP